MATQGMAAQIAKTSGKPAKTIEDELKANLIPGAVIVPAGIVAVDRAQEHGYAFVNVAESIVHDGCDTIASAGRRLVSATDPMILAMAWLSFRDGSAYLAGPRAPRGVLALAGR